MISKLKFLLFLFSFLFIFHKQASASVLFHSPLNGSDSFSNMWQIFPGDLGGTFTNNGLVGRAHYHYDIGTQQVVMKATVTITSGSVVSFRCRENFDRSTTEQATYQDQDANATNITEGINGSYTGIAVLNSNSLVGTHTFELDCLGNTITSSLDNVINSGITNASYPTNTTYVDIYASSGSTISNLVICSSADCTYPTPTPTPLPVPLVKQTSSPWNTDTYDSANKWAPLDPTINDWGCALTSAVMVLNYNGITKMPADNATITPRTLNNWLKSQPDGYIGNGLVNWLAIPRLTKLVRLANNNPGFLYDALVYRRNSSPNTTTISSDLQNSIPDILEQPNHFVVINGTTNTGFSINDPYFNKNSINSTELSSDISLGKYIPSHTDLSYIMFVTQPGLTLTLKDSQGNIVGSTFLQEPLQNDSHPGTFSGQPVQVLLDETPNTDTYLLTVNGSAGQNYDITGYLYDINGNVNKIDIEGTLDNTHPNNFTIQLNKNNVNNDSFQKIVTINTFLFDIQKEKDLGGINKLLANPLIELAKSIKEDISKHHAIPAKLKLDALIEILKALNGKSTSKEAYDVLHYDAFYLKSHL